MKNIKELTRNIIQKYSGYLENGKYYFNKAFTQLSLEDTNFVDDILSVQKDNNIVKKYINKIKNKSLVKELTIYSKRKMFNGKMLLIPSSKYGVKIFDETRVLTIYNDKTKLKSDLNNRNIINKIFSTPIILESNDNSLVEEKIINNNNTIIDVPEYILNCYINYINNNNIKVDLKEINTTKKIFRYLRKISVNCKYPTIIQHCDLWRGNIIRTDKKIYVVDYEKVDDNFILFDFFKFIFSEAYIYNDYSLLFNYFNGNFDIKIDEIFSLLGLSYNINEKVRYFKVFINLLFEERTNKKSKYKYIMEYRLLKNTLKKIEKKVKIDE